MNTSVGGYLGYSPEIRSFAPGKTIVDNSTVVGVEVELENITFTKKELKYWAIEDDGSLRNHGKEFVFKVPLSGSDVEKALTELQNFIEKYNPNVSRHKRTSVHVHVDVRDLSTKELFRLLVLYTIFERVLFHWCDEEREENNFCVPFFKADGIFPRISAILSAGNKSQFLESIITFNDDYRYAACNLNALSKFGSVEFRHMPGEYESPRLTTWINILLHLKRAAKEIEAEGKDLPIKVSYDGPEVLLKEVFQDYADEMSYPNLLIDILAGVRLASDLINNYTMVSSGVRSLHRLAKATSDGSLWNSLPKAELKEDIVNDVFVHTTGIKPPKINWGNPKFVGGFANNAIVEEDN